MFNIACYYLQVHSKKLPLKFMKYNCFLFNSFSAAEQIAFRSQFFLAISKPFSSH